MTDRPLVTVCMPSYNYGRFLPAAIDSVLEQSYEAFELLVIDNGSSDGSYEIARGYAGRDPRVRVLTHAGRENRGVNASLNLGLSEGRGAYFGLLPADDVYLPGSIERRVAALEARPEVAFVYGTAQVIDEDGSPTGQVGGRSPDEMRAFDTTGDLLQALLFHDFVPGAALLARRFQLQAVGGFDEAVYFNDWYVTVRLLARSQCAFIGSDPVVGYRHHERHRSADNLAADRPRKLELFRALRRHSLSADDRLGEARIRSLISLQWAVHAARLGELDEATEAIGDAFAADPTLAGDAAYLSWWLDARHGEWSLAAADGTRAAFLDALARPASPVEDVLAAGTDYTSFARLVMTAAPEALPPHVRERFAWTIVAEQLEAIGRGPHAAVSISVLLRGLRQPHLFGLQPFVKTLLCAAGLWGLVATTRRVTTIRER